MAEIRPFAALRYVSQKAGALESVITQPYDKITREMLERYQSLSTYNLANIIKTADYEGAARRLKEWIAAGVLARDPRPALYPYTQKYRVPGGNETVTRKGFIAAVKLHRYSDGIVFRHEQTLTGPKQDRLQLLRATRVHFGQLFMLYSDPARQTDALLDSATAGEPIERLCDEYGVEHAVWRAEDAAVVRSFQAAMADKKLMIADGHHRYETALAFREECPSADAAMMTLVNMDAPGLTILPTHRVLARLDGFDRARLLQSAARFFDLKPMSAEEGQRRLREYAAGRAIGVALAGEFFLFVLKPDADLAHLLPGFTPEQRCLDVVILHQLLLRQCLGIREDAVREEKNLEYVREFEKGMAAVAAGAPACFFLNPVRIEQMRDIALAGGVMPQKSTDFYPKLLSGLAGYEV